MLWHIGEQNIRIDRKKLKFQRIFLSLFFSDQSSIFVCTHRSYAWCGSKKFNYGFNTFTDSNNKRNVDYDDDDDDYDEGSRGDILMGIIVVISLGLLWIFEGF